MLRMCLKLNHRLYASHVCTVRGVHILLAIQCIYMWWARILLTCDFTFSNFSNF